MRYDIKDKTVLITGANRGIGKALLETFLEKGAKKVYAAVRSPEKAQFLVEEHGDKVALLPVDMKDKASIFAAALEAPDVDMVVNNAGILLKATPLEEDIFAKLDEQMTVNVHGLLAIAQAFAPVLQTNGGGVFVQLNSVASMRSFGDFASYAASKAAAYSLTQALGRYLGEQGTKVVSVHPGPIATDMAQDAGIMDMAEPPRLVAESILTALEKGDFHAFPDTMAKQLGAAYESFGEAVVLPVLQGE